jgi:hypothetical protein
MRPSYPNFGISPAFALEEVNWTLPKLRGASRRLPWWLDRLSLVLLPIVEEVLPGVLREILEAENLLTVESGARYLEPVNIDGSVNTATSVTRRSVFRLSPSERHPGLAAPSISRLTSRTISGSRSRLYS